MPSSPPSPSATPGSDSEDDGWGMPDYVHMLLLSPAVESDLSAGNGGNGGKRVLMQRQHATHKWDLPYFVYPDSLRYNGDRCTADLERTFSVSPLSDRRAFAVVAELLGEHGGEGITGDDPIGFSRLMLIEPQISLRDLSFPPHTEWKDAPFLFSLLEKSSQHMKSGQRHSLELALEYMHPSPNRLAEHRDPRYQFGWFDSAVRWLRAEVARHGAHPTGRVVQEHVSSNSTLLSLPCSTGTFYLKSPALGCEESSITAAIASLFPEDTVDVLGSSKKLHSFIMRGFDHIHLKESHEEAWLKKLAHMQLMSLHHLDTLRDAGCKDRGPVQAVGKLQELANDDSEFMRGVWGCPARFDSFKENMPSIMDLFLRLSTYNIPLTLVHGDFAKHNATIVGAKVGVGGKTCGEENGKHCEDDVKGPSGTILLFDWQFACISHPFCDLHEVYWDLAEDTAEDTVDAYLDLWSEYESRERAREAFELARKLAWFLKMWGLLDTRRRCDIQRNSAREEVFCQLHDRLVNVCAALCVRDDEGQ